MQPPLQPQPQLPGCSAGWPVGGRRQGFLGRRLPSDSDVMRSDAMQCGRMRMRTNVAWCGVYITRLVNMMGGVGWGVAWRGGMVVWCGVVWWGVHTSLTAED